jgi:hypothetical protein
LWEVGICRQYRGTDSTEPSVGERITIDRYNVNDIRDLIGLVFVVIDAEDGI